MEVLTASPTAALRSRSSSSKSNLSLDLSNLPPLITPAPPSNTLLITNLTNPDIFHPANLHNFRLALEGHIGGSLHSFSPIKSMRRIIAVFYNADDSTSIKALLDHTPLQNSHDLIRCYFGETTPIMSDEERDAKRHLQAPRVDKLFFISPPPSPPAGWAIREEDPPNRDVHAEDLAKALEGLRARPLSPTSPDGHDEDEDVPMEGVSRQNSGLRSRSATILYQPDGSDLPAIAVEDTSDVEPEGSPMEGVERKFAKTERPPVAV